MRKLQAGMFGLAEILPLLSCNSEIPAFATLLENSQLGGQRAPILIVT